MILAEGYELNGEWIPEISDDSGENLESVVQSLLNAKSLGTEGAEIYRSRIHFSMQPVEIADELEREIGDARDFDLISERLMRRLSDMLDSVS